MYGLLLLILLNGKIWKETDDDQKFQAVRQVAALLLLFVVY